ncbi:F-box only protein 16 [Oryzias melastigma]|uniref:F-box only protein 16 n=1 Tax=Oryzias melastigma TaxID=30732 RepID=A0A834FLP3_ORYME|nr:F-box only protein 16 [Oryzias melastigma]
MQTKRSAWTPMNHLLANTQIFEERRKLVAKWFNRWSDSQRKAVLQDLLLSCAEEQLRFLSLTVSRRLPLQAADFTCLLPRVICLYIFSFLDPRSLCRCARVSWHWRSIVELDQLWMPKCLKLGWCVDFSPTAFEQGVWKRHYIQTAQDLQRPLLKPLIIPDPPVVSEGPELATEGTATKTRSRTRLKQETPVPALPPWRDSDRCPKDIVRFNYLNNLDPMEQALRAASTSSSSKKDDGGRKTLSESAYKLRKAKSLMFLSSSSRPHSSPAPPPPPPPPPQTHSHPSWASRDPGSWLRLAQWNAGIRPRPVRTAVPQLGVEALRALRRSHRSIPS